MRASKSTPRWSSSSSESESESEPHEENNSTGGSLIGARMVMATAVAVVVVAVALEEEDGDETPMGDAAAITIVVAGAVIAAWVSSRMLSDNTDTNERNHHQSVRSACRYIMNTDGSCLLTHRADEGYRGPGGYGGILRNHDGNWVQGFKGFIGETYVSSRMLSDNTDTNERNHHQTSVRSACRYKMNTDGSCLPTHRADEGYRGPGGYGGILRNHDGNWVQGFKGFIGETYVLTSEFHGILKGLELLNKLNLKGAILETDCEAALKWIYKRDKKTNKLINPKHAKSTIISDSSDMIWECRRLVAKNKIEIKHIREQANRCADKLAKMGREGEQGHTVIQDLPPELRILVENDKARLGVTKDLYNI